jgi:tRNA-specific 2-thiouridylase
VKEKRVGIAMSGGVDSTSCALLLREKYEIEGFFMHLAQPDFATQKARVTSIAKKLGIRLNVIDLRHEFEQVVLRYFSSSYHSGLTPNPCVVCNREIKFGLFLENVLSHGMDKMATGHYARIVKDEERYRLYTGVDSKKDQSYFLSRLNQTQLSHILFPLGEGNKESTYMFVEQHGFNDFRGLESQDVCFLEDKRIGPFLEASSPKTDDRGPILSTSGKHLGEHHGLFQYTIGQRRGLGISSDTPLYVIALDRKNNCVIVGNNEELFKDIVKTKDLHWLAGSPPPFNREYTVRIRYSHRGAPATLILEEDGNAKISFREPQRAIAPGQFAVIYNETELLGSGVIV